MHDLTFFRNMMMLTLYIIHYTQIIKIKKCEIALVR